MKVSVVPSYYPSRTLNGGERTSTRGTRSGGKCWEGECPQKIGRNSEFEEKMIKEP